MAEKIVSPGIFVNEIDQTFLPAAIADIGAAIIGPTVKGPALVPTIVTSYSDYQATFGDAFISGSTYLQYLTSHAAEQYLKNNDKLTVVRILAGDYGNATAIVSSSIDPDDAFVPIIQKKIAPNEIKRHTESFILSNSSF